MPNLTVSVPHRLSRAEAKRRVEELVVQLQRDLGSVLGRLEEHWNGDTMSFTSSAMGMSVSGQIFVEDQAIRLDVVLPWALSMLAGTLKKQIENDAHKLLSSP